MAEQQTRYGGEGAVGLYRAVVRCFCSARELAGGLSLPCHDLLMESSRSCFSSKLMQKLL